MASINVCWLAWNPSHCMSETESGMLLFRPFPLDYIIIILTSSLLWDLFALVTTRRSSVLSDALAVLDSERTEGAGRSVDGVGLGTRGAWVERDERGAWVERGGRSAPRRSCGRIALVGEGAGGAVDGVGLGTGGFGGAGVVRDDSSVCGGS